jgi:ABC-2 type transport system permease protein
MSNIIQAIWVELLKARRSNMPLFTGLAFSLAPLAGGFFMVVLKDPDLARDLGLISTKAQIVAGSADWQTYLGLLAQATAVGGMLVFGFIAAWVFGREYAEHTIKDLLALPTARASIVFAKLIVIVLWSTGLVVVIYGIGLVVGAAVALPPPAPTTIMRGTLTFAATAGLTIVLVTPVAFFASAGQGYLPALAAALLALILAQVIAAAGWGQYFPWSVPALRAGLAGPQYASLGVLSYAIVALTSLAGTLGTLAWWILADQAQ